MHDTFSRWDDEGNGEIYNDKDEKESAATLYVVENGKEFPLTPVAKRKSFFVQQQKEEDDCDGVTALTRGVEPVILARKQVREYREECLRSASPSDSSERSSSVELDDGKRRQREDDLEEEERLMVKSSAGPYIQDEQEVLANINLVRAMKERFLHN